MRRGTVPALVFLLLTACGGEADPAGTTTAATQETSSSTSTTSTTVMPQQDETTTSTTVAADPGSETSTTTTTTTMPGGSADFAITQVVFGDLGYVIITNIGLGPGDLGGYWLCQRPSYFEIPSVELGPGDKVAVAVGTRLPDPIGVVRTIDAARALGVVVPDSGEMALYTFGSFADSEAIVDYVEWGAPDHGRSSVAVAAGIWPEGGFVETQPEALAISVVNIPANAPEDWFGDIGG